MKAKITSIDVIGQKKHSGEMVTIVPANLEHLFPDLSIALHAVNSKKQIMK